MTIDNRRIEFSGPDLQVNVPPILVNLVIVIVIDALYEEVY